MDGRRVFSVDPDRFPPQKMQDLMKYLRGRNQHYVAMVDPAVAESNYDAYNRGIEMGVFLSKNDSTPFRGVVWPVGSGRQLEIHSIPLARLRESSTKHILVLFRASRFFQTGFIPTQQNTGRKCSPRLLTRRRV
jgi:hypothetical protein